MPKVTLADIRKAADDQYGPFVIEGVDGGDVTLLAPVRLSKDKRDKLRKLDELEGDDQDKAEEIVRIAAKSPAEAKRLLAEFGGDLAQLSILVNRYLKDTGAGEASPSPS